MNNLAKLISSTSLLRASQGWFVVGMKNSFVGSRYSSAIQLHRYHVLPTQRRFTRSMWSLCTGHNNTGVVCHDDKSKKCGCPCGAHGVHSQSDKDLLAFLKDEIEVEKKAHKAGQFANNLDGFDVIQDEAVLRLTKKAGDETITITLNVNHSVGSDFDEQDPDHLDPKKDNPPPAGDMKSKPAFDVDIKRGSDTLSFTCSFSHPDEVGGEPQGQEEGYDDIFAIDELTMVKDECEEKTYAVAGEILDGYLYDLLMNALEERGITNEFVEKLSDLATAYEHKLYIGLLEKLQSFSSGK